MIGEKIMKKLLVVILPLLLIVGCSKPISEETLIDKGGLYTEWYENGNKKLEYTNNDGKMDGLRTFWYEDGQKRWLSSYKDGERDGLWTWWWEWTGDEKKFEKTYKDGKLISEKEWNEDGSVKE